METRNKVVCIDGFKKLSDCGRLPESGYPKKGEIYTVIHVYEEDASFFYSLKELDEQDHWEYKSFRPVDSTFGPAVCEQIEQIIELEETIEI